MRTAAQHRSQVGRHAGMLRSLGLDLAAPLVVYALCRRLGMSEVWALVVSGAPPGLGVLLDWIRWRTLEVVGAVVLAGIALSLVLGLASDDPRTVLLEGAVLTGAFGAGCLLSLGRRRPLIFHFAQAFYGGPHSVQGMELGKEHDGSAVARSFWRRATLVWGVAYLLEAGVRVAVIQQVSTSAALAMNRLAPWLVSGVLFAGTYVWGTRLRAAVGVAGAGSPQEADDVPVP
jgi:hypothetical protein